MFATVEMLLVAMEVPDTWFEGILPKLKSVMNKGHSADAEEDTAAPRSAPVHAETVPEGWTTRKSTTTGDTYYVNSLTGETTWSRPTRTAAEALDEFLDSGPAVWQSKVSSSTGRRYFFNTLTGATQWELPADLAGTREARRLQP